MREVEVSAKTREEAIELALKELRAERHEVSVEIIDEGSRGFLGIGARDVKIRVSSESAPDEPAPKSAPSRRPSARAEVRSAQRGGQSERRRNASPPKNAPPAKKQEKRQEPPRKAAPQTSAGDDRGDEAAALLQEVIRLMGIEAKVASTPIESNGVRLNVESPDSAILIGRKGRNLSAMQYLINRMVQRSDDGDRGERIVVDVEGYLDRRKESLEDMARRIADRAKHINREIRLKPLSPQERRIVHLTLQDDPDVRTFSLGNSVYRRVVIAPKDLEVAEDQEAPERPAPEGRRRSSNRGRRNYGGRPYRGSSRGARADGASNQS